MASMYFIAVLPPYRPRSWMRLAVAMRPMLRDAPPWEAAQWGSEHHVVQGKPAGILGRLGGEGIDARAAECPASSASSRAFFHQ